MPRIRTIKPEFWSSEQVVDCSATARLLFIGLWNFSDDAGRHVASAKRLKMEVFPGDPFSHSDILEWIDELKQAGLIIEYEVQGQSYWQVTGWGHQKIEKPNVKHPPPPIDNRSENSRLTVVDSSPPEGKGRESIGGESNTPPTPPRGKTDQKTRKFDPKSAEIPAALDTPKFRKAWEQFCEYRRDDKRKPITQRSCTMLLNKLDRDGVEAAVEAIEQSIANGWQGVFPERISKGGKHGGKSKRYDATYDPDAPTVDRL